jgi:hypothetical protein
MTVSHPDESIFEAHPSLGKYVAHHPSRRLWLVLRGAVFYAIPVGLLQLLTFRVEDAAAQLILPVLYAVIALVVVWYVAHFWNREIVLYRGGFTYREGSQIADFRYGDIARVRDETERLRFFGIFPWTRYRYTMQTRYDETLRVTNLYAETQVLIDLLDKRIAHAQLPLAREQITAGGTVNFGAELSLSREGLQHGEDELFWHELAGHRVRDGRLHLLRDNDTAWAAIPVRELDNIVLLLALLKTYRSGAKAELDPSATENANAS